MHSARGTRVSIYPRVLMFTSTSLLLEADSSFLSAISLRLLHPWAVATRLICSSSLGRKNMLPIQKIYTTGAPWGSHWKMHYPQTLLMPNLSAFKEEHKYRDILDFKIMSALFTLMLSLLRILPETNSGALEQGLAARWC